MKNKLGLFDIDGTLVNVYKHHSPAYQEAMQYVFGVNIPLEEIEMNYGKPAGDVVAIPLRKRGISDEKIASEKNRVFHIYATGLQKSIQNSQEAVLPGVKNLLEKMVRLKMPLGVVTGNISSAGKAILRATNLAIYFNPSINTYADKFSTRKEIVAAAILSAKKTGFCRPNARVLVFGDTPNDVKAARENNCVSIAVIKDSNNIESSKGGERYKRRRKLLEESEPDFLLDDFLNREEIIQNIIFPVSH